MSVQIYSSIFPITKILTSKNDQSPLVTLVTPHALDRILTYFYQIRDNRTEWFQGLEPNRGVALGKNAMLFFFLYSTYLLAVIAIFPINIGGCRLASTSYGGTSTHGHLISKVCYPESRCIGCSSTF